jgi:multiple sugar transport system ATP-binding protein
MTAIVDPMVDAKVGDKFDFYLDIEKIHIFDKESELVICN